MSYRQFAANAVANASQDRRINFIRLTYIHLGGAILSFAALCGFFVKSGVADQILGYLQQGGFSLLLFFGAFMVGGYMAEKWSMNHSSVKMQYVGLFLYTLIQAIFIAPMLKIAATYSDPSVIPSAAIMTGVVFAGLTCMTIFTKKDFSFLRGILQIASLAVFGLILCSFILPSFQLGIFFSMAMVVLAGGYILYETSAVMRHYPETAYVAASLRLFSAVALLFFYILRIFMSRD